ncbi:thiol-disulfide oxidoreductase DCC family protein [Marinobacter changyiensis]|uniref:thiol-disulfide oxidoreductase DCC family protein n=1 Tax=Marinobacter changyiensis TaxID=2604091 RepID=UPI001FED12F9|nr:DCC1-like thiol-disulfide oxidoreductase family protein [Marinobacter changyiensis]
MDTLFYDGRCPLCSREITTLRRLQDGGLGFADIHEHVELAAALPSRELLLRRLHLRGKDGTWIVGLRATVRAWSHTRYGFLFRPLLWPGLFSIATTVYERWADHRYDKRYACDVCKPE